MQHLVVGHRRRSGEVIGGGPTCALGTEADQGGRPLKPTLVRNGPATVVLHLILGASFGHIIPRATIPHAILLALCVLHISREGWPCEDWARKEKC